MTDHATYVELSHERIARTVNLSDLVMVDVDRHGQPVGVEFAVPAHRITNRMVASLDAMPGVKAQVRSRI